jgi:Transglycosylase SLT domain
MLVVAAVSGCEFTQTEAGDNGGAVTTCDATTMCNGVRDSLHTCNPNQDAYDCMILALATTAAEPDPMIFKAQVALESNFDIEAISPDTPCGVKAGWTADESKSYGLMQLTPACGWLKKALLPNGHPNLERDETAADWATSVFNPTLNIEEGVRAIQVDRAEVKKNFAGCTEPQYTMMALAAFNQGTGAVSGCTTISPAGKNYVTSVLTRYQLLARSSGYPYPY